MIHEGIFQVKSKMYACISEIIAFIEKNIETDLSAARIAQKSGYSINYINKQFKVLTGFALHEYIKGRRLFKAALYLHFTRWNVLFISTRLHFNSAAVFCRAFKQAYGLTPGEYRRAGVLGLPMALHKINVYKTLSREFGVEAVSGRQLSLHGRYFYYTVDVRDFDYPHFKIRHAFRTSFFQAIGGEPAEYYTAAWYGASPERDGLVEVTYFVGLKEGARLPRLPGMHWQRADMAIQHALAFEPVSAYPCPYDVAVNVNCGYLRGRGAVWSGGWELEWYRLKEGTFRYTYIIPVVGETLCEATTSALPEGITDIDETLSSK